MEPGIQYARTRDGVSIACSSLGSGPPLVVTPVFVWGHIQRSHDNPHNRAFIRGITENSTLIDYDHRGSGLSDRDITEFSLESFVMDLEAVVDHFRLETFALMGSDLSGPIAIEYAARHPERVSRLILWCTFAKTPDFEQYRDLGRVMQLVETNWELYTQTAAHVLAGWESENALELAKFMRESISADAYPAYWAARKEFDVTSILPKIQCPTLVMHRQQLVMPDVSHARHLASQIPNARLVILDGDVPLPGMGDTEAVVRAIDEFLGEREAAATEEPSLAGALRTVLFTDLVGHSEMMSRLGDERGREVLRDHERITRVVLAAHGGTEVKTMGDGFMASFGSVTKAVECAIALQRAFAEQDGEPLSVRVGLNAGEPIEEEGDLFGATVILASRIAAKAEGGEILVSDNVRSLSAGKGFLFSDRGEFVAKGFGEPVRVYEVRWRA
jgi:class 3 adenylate cyclase